MRSAERRSNEDQVVGQALADLVRRWIERGDWQKLKCVEMLFVRGRANQDAARRLAISEQQVANYKSDTLIQLRKILRAQGVIDDVPT